MRDSTNMTILKRRILICGAGPSGLAAAMLFHDRGADEIVVVERAESPSAFLRGKAFNYQIDPRGQQLLHKLGIKGMLEDYGLPNDDFTLTFVLPNGTSKTVKPPIIDRDRDTAYWTRRNDFIKMLQAALDKRNSDGRIKLLYGHSFDDFKTEPDGSVQAIIINPDETSQTFKPDLIVGCDGLNSAVRSGLNRLSRVDSFSMVEHPSPASDLAYKVLNFPSNFKVRGDLGEVNNHKMAFAFVSSNKGSKDAFALFALPVANADVPRSINLIRLSDHNVWKITKGSDLLDYLEQSIPQLNVRSLISEEEAEEFANMRPGRFPVPQYCKRVYERLGNTKEPLHCVLIGDSAHSFPPDLGLGVNTALEDLFVLDKTLESNPDDLAVALSTYEKEKVPENAALVRLVQTVHPYQYNQVPWRLKLWMIGFVAREILHKLSFGLLDRHAFALVQNHKMSFTEIERRDNRSKAISLGLAIAIPVVALFILF